MRTIDITQQMINCCDELLYDETTDSIEAMYELWFDVDKYFGTDTSADDTWINFYTNYHRNGCVTAYYFVETDTDVEGFPWPLTANEQVFFYDMMKQYAMVRHGCELESMFDK